MFIVPSGMDGQATWRTRARSKDAVAEMLLHPFVVVDGVHTAFSEVRSDGHRSEILRAVLLQPVDGGENHRTRGAAKQESVFGKTTAGTDGVCLLDKHHF